MPDLYVDTITNQNNTGGPTLLNGATITGNVNVSTDVNVSGILTAANLNITSGNLNITGVATAAQFYGSGANLTNVDFTQVTVNEVIYYDWVLSYTEYRA